MGIKLAAVLPYLAAIATAQQIGTTIPEVHPNLTTQSCTTTGGCVDQQTSLVTDALSRPLHLVGDQSVSCNTTPLNMTLCPDAATCDQNCEFEGVDYGSIGVESEGSAVTMRQYLFDGTQFEQVSPRLYLMAPDGENYQVLKLTNQELSFEVDASQLGCGMNGALYLSEMDPSGSRSDLNPAGATYGTGYCDAQCFNTTFINGLPNFNNSGACCNEMDIWEANSLATAMTPHTCNSTGSFLCSGDGCAQGGDCDKNGCGLNPFRVSQTFYGPGMTVDTTKPFTVVTQFFTSDNTTTGDLVEIRRLYVQDGNVIVNPPTGVRGTAAVELSTIDQDFCTAQNASDFDRLGGMTAMGQSLARGMVLIFSIWNSDSNFMSWLDSDGAGPCNATAGNPADILANDPTVSVTFSNIRWGDIGSTFNGSISGTNEGVVTEKSPSGSSTYSQHVYAVAALAGVLAFVLS